MLKAIFTAAAFAFSLAVVSTAAFADGKEGRYQIGKLPPELQKLVYMGLRDKGVEGNGKMMLYITTSDCPSNCNDKVAGGSCLCDKEDGKCPEGSSPVGGDNPGKECRHTPDRGIVSGGGLADPVQVLMP